ncbi:hypothetical protein MMC12_000341 [Toensbergia leucococca]|nr:hypothetical protein [Toensbergia leucococca]
MLRRGVRGPVHICTRRYVTSPKWGTIEILTKGTVEVFRNEAFNALNPRRLPLGHFLELPAVRKWFLQSETGNGAPSLNHAYLSRYGDTIVPLEFTSLLSSHLSQMESSDSAESVFQRAEAPLRSFLDWAQNMTADANSRFYLAQASLSTFPLELKNDLPTPDIVSQAGKGDIYDTNLWIGVPPTYTPLHRDPNPNLFVQLAGSKIVRLVEPEAGQRLFARVQESLGRSDSGRFRGDEMMQGEEKRLLEAYVWEDGFRSDEEVLAGYEVKVSKGDGLFIPKGWWHSIKGVGIGITGSVNWWFR